MMSWLKRLIGSPRLLVWLGLFVFASTRLVSLLLQLWVIPTLFSQPGAAQGDGHADQGDGHGMRKTSRRRRCLHEFSEEKMFQATESLYFALTGRSRDVAPQYSR